MLQIVGSCSYSSFQYILILTTLSQIGDILSEEIKLLDQELKIIILS